MDPDGTLCSWPAFPVLKKDLQPEIKSALRNGWGHGPHPLSGHGHES
jgi:hypothetical protein